MARESGASLVAELGGLLRLSEAQAWTMVRKACLKQGVRCPSCGCEEITPGPADRYRCQHCRRSFGLFTGRWVSRLRVPFRSRILLMRFFGMGLTLRQVAAMTGHSKNTVHRALAVIRLGIACLDRGWRHACLTPQGVPRSNSPFLFGILHRDSRVQVLPVPEPEAFLRKIDGQGSLLHANGFVCVSGAGGFDALIWHGRAFTMRPVAAPLRRHVSKDPFLAFILNCMAGLYGVDRRNFPLYLKECEARFNQPGQRLFETVVAAMADYACAQSVSS